MKATDFNLKKDMGYDLKNGITSFKGNRMVIMSANAMGLLRQNIIKELGQKKAKQVLYKFGFQNGYTDFMQMKLNYKFDTPKDLLASGPVIHTYEGIVQATPKIVDINPEAGKFYFTGVWLNSYEAEQHLTFNKSDKDPVCYTLMGYAAGWCTGFWGKLLICIEPKCMGKGDKNCEWEIKPAKEWGKAAELFIDAVKEFNIKG